MMQVLQQLAALGHKSGRRTEKKYLDFYVFFLTTLY